MPELCDKCDYKMKNGRCKVFSEEYQQEYISRGLCNFAVVKKHTATMKSKEYFSEGRWHSKKGIQVLL